MRFSPPSRKDAKGVYHKIKEGQTLWRIAKTYNVDLEHLAKINNLEEATEIKTGEWLFIPGAEKALEVEIYKPDEIKAKRFLSRRLAIESFPYLADYRKGNISLWKQKRKDA